MNTRNAMDTPNDEGIYDDATGPDDDPMTDEDDPTGKETRVRKKPGRKPNPASPAVRKAQNRAAQRAFRERKERRMREMEAAIKQVCKQRDSLLAENRQFKSENVILKSENWYLKGIVLSLQLVCYRHNIVIPRHGPYMDKETLTQFAQTIPDHVASYLKFTSSIEAPNVTGLQPQPLQDHCKITRAPILVTEDDVQPLAHIPTCAPQWESIRQPQINDAKASLALGTLAVPSPSLEHESSQDEETSPLSDDPSPLADDPTTMPHPILLNNDDLTDNVVAIQTLRLRLRLQAACVREKSQPFTLQPTLLQMTIPHDPRIDLIPTPHMRDRMILFRDQFNLDHCCQCLLSDSMFHGGDPTMASNWQLPSEFFEKYWFLTVDYTRDQKNNHLPFLKNTGFPNIALPSFSRRSSSSSMTTMSALRPTLEAIQSPIQLENVSSFPSIELSKPSDSTTMDLCPPSSPHPATDSTSSLQHTSQPVPATRVTTATRSNHEKTRLFSETPIRLTSGYGDMALGQQQVPLSQPRTYASLWPDTNT